VNASSHIVIRLATVNQQVVGPRLEDLDSTAVHRTRRGSMKLPLVNSTTVLVREHLLVIGIRHNDRTKRTTDRAPDDIGRGVASGAVVDDDLRVLAEAHFERAVGDLVEDRVVLAVGGGVADRALVHEDPLLDRLDVGQDGHARAGFVEVVGDVFDDGTPVAEVVGDLVGKLLAVLWVALIRVVCNELVLVGPAANVSK